MQLLFTIHNLRFDKRLKLVFVGFGLAAALAMKKAHADCTLQIRVDVTTMCQPMRN